MPSTILTRGVEKVLPLELAKSTLQSGRQLRVYLGIDPTGAKLHLGHSVPLRKLKAFSDAGHHVIFLVGSFTAMIGDPSGRDAMREPLTAEQVEENFRTYRAQAEKVLDFSRVEIRYNHEWLSTLSFSDVVRLGSSFTVQNMLERDMFERRLAEGKPIGLHEFFYPLMVGYDSVALDVDCELGGSDQEFNMLCGRQLQKAFGKREKFVLTTKLIAGTDGRKMSKTYNNCIYLDDDAREMYGKLLSIQDSLIVPYMECCTDISDGEIQEAIHDLQKGNRPKEWKMRLAREIVTLYHSKNAAEIAEQEFVDVFSRGGVPSSVPEVRLMPGQLLIDLLLSQKLITSRTDARRLLQQGGIYLNDCVVTALDALAEEGIARVGKRKFLRIVR